MTLKKYNSIQIKHIICFAKLCHEDVEEAAIEWVNKYSKEFSNKVKKLGIKIF